MGTCCFHGDHEGWSCPTCAIQKSTKEAAREVARAQEASSAAMELALDRDRRERAREEAEAREEERRWQESQAAFEAEQREQQMERQHRAFEGSLARQDEIRADHLLSEALVLLEAQMPADAVRLLQKAAQLDPATPSIRIQFALAHHRSGDTDEAAKQFDAALRLAKVRPLDLEQSHNVALPAALEVGGASLLSRTANLLILDSANLLRFGLECPVPLDQLDGELRARVEAAREEERLEILRKAREREEAEAKRIAQQKEREERERAEVAARRKRAYEEEAAQAERQKQNQLFMRKALRISGLAIIGIFLIYWVIVAVSSMISSIHSAYLKSGIDWIKLDGGRFEMGDKQLSFTQPVHTVSIRPFEISKTEVTVKMYRRCVDDGACSDRNTGREGYVRYERENLERSEYCNFNSTDRDDHPMNCVDWGDAQAFSKWIGARLCSEAEWEYAARSCGKEQKYPWGDEEATCERAVMIGSSESCGRRGTWAVCSKQQGNSEQGVCDLAGNVREWIGDCFHWDYQGAPVDGSAWLANTCEDGVMARGGGGDFSSEALLSASRGDGWQMVDQGNGERSMGAIPPNHESTIRQPLIGFRLCRDE